MPPKEGWTSGGNKLRNIKIMLSSAIVRQNAYSAKDGELLVSINCSRETVVKTYF
jgi:hypothetical protein